MKSLMSVPPLWHYFRGSKKNNKERKRKRKNEKERRAGERDRHKYTLSSVPSSNK